MSVRKLPRLILVEPNGARREIALARTPLSIGRGRDSDLPLRDNRISRQHAVIRAENGRYLIEDCQSRYGTFVNGERVEASRELRNNDCIEFGVPDSYALIFVSEEESLQALLNRVDTPASPDTISRELRNLSLLLEVGRSLHAGLALEDVLATVLDACLKVTGTERGFLLLRNNQGQLELRVARDRDQRSLTLADFSVNYAVIHQALEQVREIVVTDTRADTRLAWLRGGVEHSLPAVICLPLPRSPSVGTLATTVAGAPRDAQGFVYLDSHQLSRPISKTERQILRSLAFEAARVVENARLFTAARAKERLDQELAIARDIQQGLLPRGPTPYDFFQMACFNIPCYQVGGDYYDLIELPDRRFALVMADVSGKGISAALLSSSLQGALTAGLAWGQPIASVICHLNRYLYQHTEISRFATFFCGVLSPEGRFEYVNAGHCPALWLTSDGIETLQAQNVPLGLFEQSEYASSEIQLRPHDVLVLCTDGVVEASDPAGELYGMERLKNVLCARRGNSSEKLAAAVLEDVREFAQNMLLEDDVSLMIARYEGSG